MDHLVISQVGQVVRVLGKKRLLFRQFVRIATIFQRYSTSYDATLEEAEDKLANFARRKGLRFLLHRHQIEYRTYQEVGQGLVVDISQSGCTVQAATVPLTPAMQIFVKIKFYQGEDNPVVLFTIVANVVRAKDDTFAVQFLDLDEGQQEVLFKCLAFETRCEIPES